MGIEGIFRHAGETPGEETLQECGQGLILPPENQGQQQPCTRQYGEGKQKTDLQKTPEQEQSQQEQKLMSQA